MKMVNEAWEVLSNPEVRLRYDQERAEAVRPIVERTVAPTRPNPAPPSTDPHGWGIFEPLRIAIAQDFARAKFRPGLRKWIGWSMPGDSVSGCALVLVGTMTGGLIIAKLLSMEAGWMGVHPFAALVFLGCGTLIGGELAVKVHGHLARGVFALAKPL